MRTTALFLFALAFALSPVSASADALTKEQMFALYVKYVDKATIAQRLDQLYTAHPAGAFKDNAAATLKQDLANGIQNALDRWGLVAAPIEAEQDDVGDSTLP
jgi:hypothetical protein